MRTPFHRAAALLGALACSGGGPTESGDTPTGAIVVRNNAFDPSSFTATAGEAVVWAWSAGAATHNVTFESGGPNSPNQSSGTFSRTFAEAGAYPYHCAIHGAAMGGTVTVVADGGNGGTGDDGGNDGGGDGGGGNGGTEDGGPGGGYEGRAP